MELSCNFATRSLSARSALILKRLVGRRWIATRQKGKNLRFALKVLGMQKNTEDPDHVTKGIDGIDQYRKVL